MSDETKMNEETQGIESCEIEMDEKTQGAESSEVEMNENMQETAEIAELLDWEKMIRTLGNVAYIEVNTEVVPEGADEPVQCVLWIIRQNEAGETWQVVLMVLDYDLWHERGQEVVERALAKLGMPDIHGLVEMVPEDDVVEYEESLVDLLCGVEYLPGQSIVCQLSAKASLEEAWNLVKMLQKNNPQGSVQLIIRGSLTHRKKLAADIQYFKKMRGECEEMPEQKPKMWKREFDGLENLEVVVTGGWVYAKGEGAFGDLLLMRVGDKWMLTVMINNYDAECGNGQKIVEGILERCELPGIRELSEIADAESSTPWYREVYWVKEDTEDLEDGEGRLRHDPQCTFQVFFDQGTFEELLEKMATGPRKEHLAFGYRIKEDEDGKGSGDGGSDDGGSDDEERNDIEAFGLPRE